MDEAPTDRELGPGDFVLRRIHRNHVKPELPTPVLRLAFCPNPKDTTGISVYDQGRVSPRALVDVKVKPESYYVARISVQALLDLRLSFLPEDDVVDHVPGHYVVPQLRFEVYQGDKRGSEDLQRRLAELASADIVLSPPDTLLK